jgi:hypothetical protein
MGSQKKRRTALLRTTVTVCMTDRTPPLPAGIHGNLWVAHVRRESLSARNEQRMEFLRMTSMMSGDGSFAGTRDVRFRDGQPRQRTETGGFDDASL